MKQGCPAGIPVNAFPGPRTGHPTIKSQEMPRQIPPGPLGEADTEFASQNFSDPLHGSAPEAQDE